MQDSLQIIDNKEAIQRLLGNVEQEYFYTEKDIVNLMKNGSLDEFLDCLDFAPEGVIDLIKNLAVKLPLNDVAKREAIFNKTGFSVDNALRIEKEIGELEKNTSPVTARRVVKEESKPTSGTIRRTVVKRTN